MLDFGWPELFMIIAVAVFVIGPSEIPNVMQALGRLVRRAQYVKYAFSQQFEDFMRESDLDDIRKQVNFEAAPDNMEFNEAEADDEYAESFMTPLPENIVQEKKETLTDNQQDDLFSSDKEETSHDK